MQTTITSQSYNETPLRIRASINNLLNSKSFNKLLPIFIDPKTIKLLKLTREALIYLTLGIHIEERKKSSNQNKPIMPMYLDSWEDEWKR